MNDPPARQEAGPRGPLASIVTLGRRRARRAARLALHSRSQLLLYVALAIAASFVTPILGILVLASLFLVGVAVGGHSQLAIIGAWIFALFTIWPRNSFGPFNVTPAMALSFVALGLYCAGRIVGSDEPPPRLGRMGGAVLVLAWVFVLTYAVGLARPITHSSQVEGADRSMMVLFGGIGITLLVNNAVRDERALRRVLAAVVGAGTVMAVFAVLQFTMDLDLRTALRPPGFQSAGVRATEEVERFGLRRAAGTASHPIELSVTAAVMLPLAFHFAAFAGSVRHRRWAAVSALLLVLAVGMSVSRSGLVTLGLVLALVAPTWSPARRFRLYTGAVLFGVAAAFLVPQMIDAAVGSIVNIQGNQEEGGASNLAGRTERYSVVRDLVGEHPVLGRGYGTFDSTAFFALDNQYLGLLIEVGVVGTTVFLGVLMIGMGRLRSIRRRPATPAQRDLAQGLFASLVGLSVAFAFFDGLAFHFSHGLLFLLFGAIAALDRLVPLAAATDAPPTLVTSAS